MSLMSQRFRDWVGSEKDSIFSDEENDYKIIPDGQLKIKEGSIQSEVKWMMYVDGDPKHLKKSIESEQSQDWVEWQKIHVPELVSRKEGED
jgi:hypothetical protein